MCFSFDLNIKNSKKINFFFIFFSIKKYLNNIKKNKKILKKLNKILIYSKKYIKNNVYIL